MKKWNTPELAELNVNETANGIFDTEVETLVLLNNSHKKPCTPKPTEPTTPEEGLS